MAQSNQSIPFPIAAFLNNEIEEAPRFRDGLREMMVRALLLVTIGTCAAAPVLVTELIRAGRSLEARNASAIIYNGVAYGFGGHYTVAAQHRPERDNHLYTWFQPCRDCDFVKAPLLIW